MIPTKAFAAPSAGAPLGPFSFERRDPGPLDVAIDISHCGVCHTARGLVPTLPGVRERPRAVLSERLRPHLQLL